MHNARTAALTALNRCFKSGAWASQVLDNEIKDLDQRDRALATRLTMGVIQNYMLLDFYIDSLCKKLDLPVRNILRMGAYQIVFSDRIPDRAAVNESVELCRAAGYKSATGLVNAVLRKIAAGGISQPEELYVKYSHPKWFVDRMIADKGLDFTIELLKANNGDAEICTHEAFSQGERYVQDRAAYEAVVMAAPSKGMSVIDVCAAPGGKSFTSAVMMENSGRILSCDIHEKKLNLIREGSMRLGIDIIETVHSDALVHNPDYDEAFDLVIADVPCSGFGVIRKKPEIRFKTEDEIAGLPSIQKKILSNVSSYVKPGGKILYSTCTVFKEENEDVSSSLSGFTKIKEKTFWPNVDGTDGFYACVMIKNE